MTAGIDASMRYNAGVTVGPQRVVELGFFRQRVYLANVIEKKAPRIGAGRAGPV